MVASHPRIPRVCVHARGLRSVRRSSRLKYRRRTILSPPHPCSDSRRTTATVSKFPVSDRNKAAKVFAGTPTLEFACSPGPGAYDVKR